MRGLVRQVFLLASGAALLVTNLFGGGGGSLEGNGSNDMYSKYPTAFSPAPYTFAVWGPIFVGVMVFAIYQAMPSRRTDERLDALGVPMTLAYLACAATAYTSIGLSNLVLFVVLGALIWAYLTQARFEDVSRGFFWCVSVPISIFFAWINVATILNISQWLVSVGFTGFGISPQIWSAGLMLVAAAIGWLVTTRYRDVAFALVFIWAFWGIVVAQRAATPIFLAAALGTTILVGACAVALLRGRASSSPTSLPA